MSTELEAVKEIPKKATDCTLYLGCKMLLQTEEGFFCSICYELCSSHNKPPYSKVVHDNKNSCSCMHGKEDEEFYENLFLDNFEKYKTLNIRQALALNQLISLSIDGTPILSYMNSQPANMILKDYETLNCQTFKWDEIDIPAIEKRASFIKQFNIDIPEERFSLLNTEPFEKLISLKFLDMVTENPNLSFGTPLYNNSLNYYTYLLKYFIIFYLKKDLLFLDKIDAEDIETYTPIGRYYIRCNNRQNSKLRAKYFNEEFNLIKFAIKMVEKFVIGATWRWIGGNHMAHVYCIEICKIVIECGIASLEECEEIKHALYLKIQVYRSLENIIDKDSKTIAEVWVNKWLDGMKNIREYYIEILINCLYFQQDNEVLEMLVKSYKESKKGFIKHEDQLKPIIRFQKSILFEEEFGRKTMDFLLSYILSQNNIASKLITTKKIEAIADNFLHIFSNMDDPYLHSLKLIREEDFLNYAREETKENPPSLYIKQDFLNIANDLTMLLSKIEKGVFLYQENNLILELENLLEKFNVKLNINSNQNHEIRSFSTQRLLFQSGIPNMILNIIGNLMQFSDHLVTFPSEKLLEKFKNLIEYYLKDNLEMQSSFFSIRNFRLLEQIFYKFPTLISDLLFDIFSKNAQILITKEYALDILMEMFKKHYTNLNNTVFLVKDYSDLSKIVDTEALFINLKCFKIFNWIPEYDIRILEDAMKFQVWPEEETGFLFHIDELESLLKSYQGDKTLLADARLDFLMNYLSFINVVTSYRYTDEVYKKLDSFLPIGKLKNLISLCGKRLEFRSVLLEIYGNIHIDFKNHLLNKRSSYYFTKPADMQYEEDPFFDKEYDNTVDLFISELKFLIEEEKGLKKIDEREFFNYLNSSLLGNLVKLMNYFLVIKEGDLHKLNKYIAKLEELNDYIYINRFIILAMYSVFQKEFDSPDRKLLEIELSKIDPNLKIKKDKTQIIGNCKAIIDLCKGIMCNRPVLDNKKGLISAKSTVNRINDTYLKTLNFSNKLQTRRNNLKLPFTKLLNKKDKTTGKIQITKCLTAYYEHYKMTMMSVDAKENVYIATLSENSVEMQNYAKNLCAFIYNQLVSEWNYKEKNKKYTMIESLCNNLFISTKSIQANLFEFMTEQGENNLLAMNKIWTEMKEIMSFVKYKTNIDRFWKEAFRRTMLLIKFHQFLCEDSNQSFKNFMREKILPDDTIDRLQRWTTILQRISDSCQWHYNYVRGEISDFLPSHRPYLLPLATGTFENLAELCTGPMEQNQKKIYTYIYDRYNGILRRFWRDSETEFYRTKLALIDFMLAMIEGMDPDVVNYHTTNFELTTLNWIIVNSIRQLYYCVGKKDPFTKAKLSEYPLIMKNYDEILHHFESNTKFANHPLLNISLKLFGYIKLLGELKSKYSIFSKERDEHLAFFEAKGTTKAKSITEEDLVVYKFLRRILTKIEIKRSNGDETKLVSYHFSVLSKCLYLSEETKKSFLNEVDRSSQGSKLSGMLANIEYFQIEMENNEERFRNYYLLYKLFGAGKTYYFELTCLILCFINNILLLVDFQYTEEVIIFSISYRTTVLALGLIEIAVSILAIIAYYILNYSFEKIITRKKFLQTHADKNKVNRLERIYLDYWLSFFSKKEVFVFIYHIIFVALGLSLTYGLIGIDLFSIIFFIPSMQYIVRSVTEHLNHILSTLLLAAIVIYAYSIFVHLYFQKFFNNEMVGECENLSHCYFTILDRGFRNGEGIGGLLELAYYGTGGGDSRFYGSLFLNISFFLIINTVLLNIILAVLVDTFSDLRQRSDAFKVDSQNICFICGIEKFDFEKSGIDFEMHTSNEHNIWDYVNFLVFMRHKTEKDCNGIEEELFEKIKQGDSGWFPQGRSMTLEKVRSFERTASIDNLFDLNLKVLDTVKEVLKLTKAKA